MGRKKMRNLLRHGADCAIIRRRRARKSPRPVHKWIRNNRCLCLRPPQGQGVKGKQVQILYDLVTVIGKCEATCVCTATDRWLGRLLRVMILQPGNLPAIWYRKSLPRPRVLGRIGGAQPPDGKPLSLVGHCSVG